MAPLALSAGLIIWCALCALQDAREKRISNWLTLPGLTAAVLYLLLTGQSLTGASTTQAGLALGLALLFAVPGYRRGHMGAGDLKLLCALALASDVLHLLLSVAGAGLAMLAWALLSPRLWPRLPARAQSALRLLQPGGNRALPYAPFLLCGLLLAMAWHWGPALTA